MKRKTKQDKRPTVIRGHIAQNVIKLRDLRFSDLENETARNRKLASLCECSLSHIQRICKAEQGIGVDMLESLARALDVKPQDLVTPYFQIVESSEPSGPKSGRSNKRAG